jgi:hypothetical protein
MGSYLAIYVAFAAPLFLLVLAVWFLVRKLETGARLASVVLTSTLLLSPSWGSATIVTVPVPFGFLLLAAVVDGSLSSLTQLVALFPIWHTVAFPATAVVSYVVVRVLLSNNSFKRTRVPRAA